MSTHSLIYIHIGKKLPTYIYDSIYQTLLVSPDVKIYVILDDSLITDFRKVIEQFNINLYLKSPMILNVECIPISILELPNEYETFVNGLPNSTKEFRDAFWISTTARFFYIESLMKLFKLTSVFHIENDNMLYENLNDINLDKNKMYMLKDGPNRVIPSIMYIPSITHITKLNNFIMNVLLSSNRLLNDMELLGHYNDESVTYFPYDFLSKSQYIFDGAAIGQYVGGIDPRNLPDFSNKSLREQELLTIDNPTKKFINESCTFKPNTVSLFRKNINLNNKRLAIELMFAKNEKWNSDELKQIVNLHIHSKQLYQFSSVFNIKFGDIITGDRVVSLCDFVILTDDIFRYHQNLDKFIDINKIIVVKDFNNVNMKMLNMYFKEDNKKTIKLFIYTHILELFTKYILPKLDTSLDYILYLHNSDHGLSTKEEYNVLSSAKHIKLVYSQNMALYMPNKFKLLPIGIANSMFRHGDILSLYKIMSNTYYKKKVNNLYININPNTYPYRYTVLNKLKERPNDFSIVNVSKPYNEYLEELASYRFCLCVRGNGIACHREWECYYLGVIPVIINNKYTNLDAYVKYLTELNLPFYEIKSESFDKYSDDFFNEELYRKILYKTDNSFYNLQAVKLSYYS